MTPSGYYQLRGRVLDAGYGQEYQFYQNVPQCTKSRTFFCEYAWVVLNSGMKNQVAAGIRDRVWAELGAGGHPGRVFSHTHKARALWHVWVHQERLWREYQAAGDKVSYLRTLPWIGPITQWHLAKNLGHDCAKPDRHLVRIAAGVGETVDALCARLALATGDRIATVDYVLWRAANLGWA